MEAVAIAACGGDRFLRGGGVRRCDKGAGGRLSGATGGATAFRSRCGRSARAGRSPRRPRSPRHEKRPRPAIAPSARKRPTGPAKLTGRTGPVGLSRRFYHDERGRAGAHGVRSFCRVFIERDSKLVTVALATPTKGGRMSARNRTVSIYLDVITVFFEYVGRGVGY